MASRRRFGAFVYTVAPWAWVVGGLGIAIVYTNGRIGPLGAVLRRLCTLLRLARRPVVTQGDAIVYTNRWKWPPRDRFGAFVYTVATRVTIRIATRVASGGTSASATMACRRRLLAGPSRLVGKTGSERAAPLPGWHLGRDVNPHEPLKSPLSQCRPEGSKRQPGKSAIVNSSHASTPVFLWWAASESVTARTMPRWRFPPDRRPYPQTAHRRPAE